MENTTSTQLFLSVPIDAERVERLLFSGLAGAGAFEWIKRGPTVDEPLMDIILGEASATFTGPNGVEHILNQAAVRHGLHKLYLVPSVLAEVVSDQRYRVSTAQTFLQLCLFGEVVYG